MKKFLEFLVDLFVILLELAICAGAAFWLVSHPIIKQEAAADSIVTRSRNLSGSSGSSGSSGFSDSLSISTRVITARPIQASLDIPPVIWIPEHFAPEKQWGYDRVYSCTRLERIPGFWHIPGAQSPTFPYFPVNNFECPIRYF